MKRFFALVALLCFASPTWAQAPAHGRGYIPPTPEVRKKLYAESFERHGHRLAMLAKFQQLPGAFDTRANGWDLPTGDQGQCGSCYLYSTCRQASAAFVKAGWGKPDGSLLLAVQYGMDRPRDFGGCNGGNGTEVIDWMCKNGWIAESYIGLDGQAVHDYPAYSASSGSDRTKPGAKRWTPAAWGFCTSDQSQRQPTTTEIKTAMYNYGVLNISLDAGGQFGNGTGTITSLGSNIDHEIQMVAWDDAKDGGAFLLQNQWSTDWGNGGFRWVTYTAAQNMVDLFWVSATPLPPPPPPPPPVPPPVPPGPIPPPGGPVIVTLTPGQVALVLQQAGVTDNEMALRQKMKEIQAILDSIKSRTEPGGVAPTTNEPPMLESFEVRLAKQWAIEKDANRAKYKTVLAVLFDESEKRLSGGLVVAATFGEFVTSMKKAVASSVPDTALVWVRQIVFDELNSRTGFKSTQALDEATKSVVATELKRISTLLEKLP